MIESSMKCILISYDYINIMDFLALCICCCVRTFVVFLHPRRNDEVDLMQFLLLSRLLVISQFEIHVFPDHVERCGLRLWLTRSSVDSERFQCGTICNMDRN